MSANSFNPHITISSPFGVADLPTLCVWRNRLHRLNGEPEEELGAFMEQHLERQDVKTFAAYRDDELGGYFEAAFGELTFFADSSMARVARVEMCFKREFFKRRPEKENGASAGGQEITQPALNLVLRELFEEFEMIFFPIGKQNRPIQSLVSAVGAVSIGDGESEQGPLAIFVLSRAEWERVNVGFIAEYEAEAAVRDGMQRTLETIFHEAESPVFARVAEEDE